MALQHLRSSTAHKRPIPTVMSAGQIAINTNEASPGLFFKDSNGDLVKVGPVHIGPTAPNSSPASVAATALVTGTVYQILTVGTSDFTLVGASANTVGTIFTATGTTTGTGTVSGQQGVEKGEMWLDTTGGTYVLKVYDGTDWRSESGTFVDVNGDTMTGDLVMNNANIVFEGATANDFETTLTVTDPTADRTITLPNVTGTVVTTGDTGSVTSTMIADGTIVNADVNASAAIAGTKIDPDFGSQTIETTGVINAGSGTAAAPSVSVGTTDNGIYSPGSDQLAISTNGTGRLFVDANGNVGLGISPTTRFHVYQSGSTQAGLIETNQSASVLNFKSTGQSSGQPQVGCASSDMILNTNGSERLRITSTGTVNIVGAGTAGTTQAVHFNGSAPVNSLVVNSSGSVGIGTSSPAASLDVNATTTAPLIRIDKTTTDTNTVGNALSIFTRTSGTAAAGLGSKINFITENINGTSYETAYISAGTSTNAAANKSGFLAFSTAEGSNNPIERVRIDSSGRLGIGTTSPDSELHISKADTTTKLILERTNSSTAKWSMSAGGGSLLFKNEASSTEAMRLDSSGRLLVGTSSPLSSAGYTSNLQVQASSAGSAAVSIINTSNDAFSGGLIIYKARGSSSVQSGDGLGQLRFAGYDGTVYVENARIEAYVDGTPGTNDMPGRLVFSTTADGSSSPTERMRISSDGRTDAFATSETLRVRTAATTAAAAIAIRLQAGATSITAGGTTEFQVTSNGNVANTNNSYGAISDIKLKENIVDANSQWDDIKALQVRNYNFKEGQTHKQIGLIAQEVEPISPGLVYESPDYDAEGNDLGTVTKSVNYSVLYMKAVKALQEAMERIETLEAKVAALEAS